MSSGCNDILQMLDYLKLPVMAESLERMMDDPASFELSVLDFLKQIVSDEYVERHNSKTATLIRLSAISGMMGDVSQLYTHDGRIYNDNIVRQVKELSFLTNRRNVCVFPDKQKECMRIRSVGCWENLYAGLSRLRDLYKRRQMPLHRLRQACRYAHDAQG